MITATRLFASAMLSTMRMLEENRRVLFCAKDTAKTLGSVDTAKAMTKHSERGVGNTPSHQQNGIHIKFIAEETKESVIHRLLTGVVHRAEISDEGDVYPYRCVTNHCATVQTGNKAATV